MTEKAPLAAVIAANIEILDQCIDRLVSISCTAYTKVINPVMSSSIGSHIRHIADTYRAVINGLSSKQVGFNFCRRNTAIESQLSKALSNINQFKMNLSITFPPGRDFQSSPIRRANEVTSSRSILRRIGGRLSSMPRP
jgi:hypothetical protein